MNDCKIDECTNPHHARGWCSTHYTRWRKHGSPHVVHERGAVAWGRKQSMDNWETRRVTRLLRKGVSYRNIQRATGIGYMTVCRFARRLREMENV